MVCFVIENQRKAQAVFMLEKISYPLRMSAKTPEPSII